MGDLVHDCNTLDYGNANQNLNAFNMTTYDLGLLSRTCFYYFIKSYI